MNLHDLKEIFELSKHLNDEIGESPEIIELTKPFLGREITVSGMVTYQSEKAIFISLTDIMKKEGLFEYAPKFFAFINFPGINRLKDAEGSIMEVTGTITQISGAGILFIESNGIFKTVTVLNKLE